MCYSSIIVWDRLVSATFVCCRSPLIALSLLIALLGASSSAQQSAVPHPVVIHAGFFTGKQFLDLDKSEREIYASGLFDGLMAAGWLGAKETSVARIHDCIPSVSNDQFAAVIERYLRQHPERWNVYMSVVATEALTEICR